MLFFDVWGHRAVALGKAHGRWPWVKDARTGIILAEPNLADIFRTAHRAPFRTDADDEWQAPVKTLQYGGDCEDFALLYRSLFIEAGGRDEASAMVLVKDRSTSRINFTSWHAVTLFAVGPETMMLDVNAPGPIPAKHAIDYVPVIAYCGPKVYVYGKGGR